MHNTSFFKSPKGLNLSSVDFHPTPDARRELSQLDRLSGFDAPGALARRAAPSGSAPLPFFVLLDGPPYANGLAHAGHLLNRALKDFALRAHALGGERAQWRPGWDCHGLPLELAVEKRHGPQTKANPVEFARLAREEAMLWSSAQENAFKRLGTLSDWRNPWRTMEPVQESRTLALALELFEEGLLAPASAPVHWCPACQSSLAASELEPLSHARLEVAFTAPLTADSAARLLASVASGLDTDAEVSVACWTSAPWTLWGSAAYAFEAGVAMALASRAPSGQESGDANDTPETAANAPSRARFLLSPAAALDALRLATGEALPLVAELPAEAVARLALFAQRPLGPGLNPLVAAGRDVARAEDGLGWTHLAPSHGPEDHACCEPLGLAGLSCAGADGRASADAVAVDARLDGLSLKDMSAAGAEALDQASRLLWRKSVQHDGQGCWRHKTPFYFRDARQWFLSLTKTPRRGGLSLRDAALKANASAKWLPQGTPAASQMESMLLGRDRWCVSRSRLWGLPLPLYRDAQGRAHPDSVALWSAFLPRVSELGAVEAWSQETAPDGFEKEAFCLDVWFDSGSVFEAALGRADADAPQASLMSEGRDQTRGWFLASFLLSAWKREGLAPAEAVFCHGFCLGEDGKKLSKSNGGGAPVDELFEKHGADTLRLWASLSEAGADPVFSAQSLEGAKKELRALKMALRFALMNGEAPGARAPEALRPLDAFFLREWAQTERSVLLLARESRFEAALRLLVAFCRRASSQWFDASKNTLYLEPLSSMARQSAAWALGAFFERMAPLSSLFAAFSAEEAWQQWSEREAHASSAPLACLVALGWEGPSGGLWALAETTPWLAAADLASAWRAEHGSQAERMREAWRSEVGVQSALAGRLREGGFTPEAAGRLLGVACAWGLDADDVPAGWAAQAGAENYPLAAEGSHRWLRAPAACCPRCKRRRLSPASDTLCERCVSQKEGVPSMGLMD